MKTACVAGTTCEVCGSSTSAPVPNVAACAINLLGTGTGLVFGTTGEGNSHPQLVRMSGASHVRDGFW